MKKIVIFILTLLLVVASCFSIGCNKSNDGPKSLSFYAPDGAPALAIAKFIKDNENFGIDGEITYNVVSSNEIGGVMSQGKGDFIVMPVNAASKLYKANADDAYILAGVVTHGNLYLVSTEKISLQTLKGKVVGVIGQGLVPDLTLKAILSDNGLLDLVVTGDTPTEDKITLRYFASAQDMLPMLKKGELTIGLVPEPATTKLTTTIAPEKDWEILDVQALYNAESKAYPQAVLMVRKSVYEPFKENISTIGEAFAENVKWIKENTEEAVNVVNSKLLEGVTPSLDAKAITPIVVDNCKIFWQSSADAKLEVQEYLNKIVAVNAEAAKVVTDEFFA